MRRAKGDPAVGLKVNHNPYTPTCTSQVDNLHSNKLTEKYAMDDEESSYVVRIEEVQNAHP